MPKPDAPAHIYATGAAANLSVDAQIQVMQIHNWRGQGKFVLAGDAAPSCSCEDTLGSCFDAPGAGAIRL